jgi:signal transduction histidine kinase/ActR/RegA family two-component response regulator
MPLPEHRVLEHNRNQGNGERSAQPIGELPPAICADLLDPALWQDGLAKYARCTNLAVVLADAAGRLIGSTINPRPTWSFLHSKTPPLQKDEGGRMTDEKCPGNVTDSSFILHLSSFLPGCPFSLARLQPCNCVVNALARRGVVVARDQTGLVHFAVPLVLGEHPLGALVAGQVFTGYPEQLPLEHVARQLLLPPGKAWELARLEHPFKRATLEVYADLLATLGQTFLQTRYHSLREAERLAEMTRLRDHAVAEATQRKLVEESLQEVDRRKDEFLAMLSHELRNPLAAILSAVQLLQLQKGENSVQQKARAIIERQVRQLTHLVDDLMEVSRTITGRIQLRQEQVTMRDIVERAVETARPLIDERGHELTVSLPPDPICLNADASRLEQVVTNLLANAAKYSNTGGHIWLSVQQEGDKAVLRVRDTGLGITSAFLPHVFDLFTQAERSSDRSQGGLGIGLALVKRLVEMHGGTIGVSSTFGQGSEFVVSLAASEPGALSLKTQPPSTEIAKPTGPALRVLVVDDNVDAATALEMLVEASGHRVWKVHTAEAALAAALDYRPDVMLLDIGLPELDGFEVAKRIRQQPVLQNIVLVAVTGYGRETDRQRSQEARFDHHLVKPVDFRKVQQILATVSEKGDLTRTERVG